MKLMLLPAALLLVLALGQAYVVVIQGNTIQQQRTLIQEMAQNPQCLVPAKDPAFHN